MILGCDPLLMPLTGIGHYTQNLGRGLLSAPSLNGVELFAHGRFFSNSLLEGETEDVLKESAEQPRLSGFLRSARSRLALSPLVVKTYQTIFPYVDKWALRNSTDRLFHAPNFILPNFDGPKVVTIHDLSTLRFPEHHPQARVRFVNHAIENSLNNADQIITDSDFIKAELVNLLGAEPSKVTAVPLGADPEFKPRTNELCDATLTKYNLTFGSYFLFVSTIEPRKNLLNLLKAFENYRAIRLNGLPLVIVGGDGWHNREILEKIDKLMSKGWIRRLGYLPQKDMPILFSGGRALLFPSSYEGFGLPVLEALQSGLPVMTSDNSSMSEIVGNCALLVEKNDIDTMVKYICLLEEDDELLNKLSQSGLVRARCFSWQKCIEGTIKVYDNLSRSPKVNG